MRKLETNQTANEDGFSLIELVVAVGILLILTVGGLVGYKGVTDNAIKAATQSAVSEVITAAVIYKANGDHPLDAVTDWMNSSDGESIIVDGQMASAHITGGGTAECLLITADHKSGYHAYRVHGHPDCNAEFGLPDAGNGGTNPNPDPNDGNEEECNPAFEICDEGGTVGNTMVRYFALSMDDVVFADTDYNITVTGIDSETMFEVAGSPVSYVTADGMFDSNGYADPHVMSKVIAEAGSFPAVTITVEVFGAGTYTYVVDSVDDLSYYTESNGNGDVDLVLNSGGFTKI